MKRMISFLVPTIVVGFLMQGCTTTHNAHANPHWGYEGNTAPKYWGSLSPEFRTCSTGKLQTPIDIVPTVDKKQKPLNFAYKAPSKNVINNGHSVQVNIESGNTLTYKGKTYELKQFHFHTPSENHIYGNSFPLEAHFVHVSNDGKIAVVGVMYEYGKENDVLAKIWSKFPLEINQPKKIALSSSEFKSLMPSNKEYYSFLGSLTTPPCTEGVEWIVYKNSLSVSKEQVKEFFDVFGHFNNRPIQATNGREIIK